MDLTSLQPDDFERLKRASIQRCLKNYERFPDRISEEQRELWRKELAKPKGQMAEEFRQSLRKRAANADRVTRELIPKVIKSFPPGFYEEDFRAIIRAIYDARYIVYKEN